MGKAKLNGSVETWQMVQKTATVLATRDTYTGSVQPYPTARVCKGVEHKAFLPLMLPETYYQPDTVPAALSSMRNNIDRLNGAGTGG